MGSPGRQAVRSVRTSFRIVLEAAMSRILIVEDDDRIRESTRILLEDEGYVVDEAVTGEEGLAVVEEASSLDCVLLDLLLPGRDGFDICRSIRRVSQVPV